MDKRVYPREKKVGASALSVTVLALALVFLLSGVLVRRSGGDIDIAVTHTPAPTAISDVFDETMEQREITLPAATWYALQLGVFENGTAAEQLSSQFQKRGAAGYVWQDGRYRVLAAVYPAKEDAQSVRQRILEQHLVDSYLYQIDLPAMHLRITGMKGQLDILQAAFAHVHDAAAQLQQISVLLDRQEITVEQACERLESLSAQAEEVTLRMAQRFSAPRHATVDGLLTCLNDLISFCASRDANASATVFSTQLKHRTFAVLDGLRGVYDTLSTT